jgi:hypothetical protein
MANKTKGAKKNAPRRAYTPRKGAVARTNRKEANASEDSFEVVEGVPNKRTNATAEDERKILNTLAKLKPDRNHGVIPSKFKSATKRLAERNYPQHQLRMSYNKAMHTISVWWGK